MNVYTMLRIFKCFDSDLMMKDSWKGNKGAQGMVVAVFVPSDILIIHELMEISCQIFGLIRAAAVRMWN